MQASPEISFLEQSLSDIAVDHQVEVNSLTGAAVVSVALPTTPGRSDFSPSLALQYNSSAGNSVYGVGWSLSGVSSIGLSSKRLPKYEGDDLFVFNGSEELIPMLEKNNWEPIILDEDPDFWIHYYRSKVEQDYTRFEKRVHRETGRIHWRVLGPDNSVAIFGYDESGDSRIQAPDDHSRTYQWLIEAQYDDSGNAIRYEYKPENWDNIDIGPSYERQRFMSGNGLVQRYLKRILYGNTHPLSAENPTDDNNRWLFQVVFDYGDHNDDPRPSHEPDDQWSARSDPFSTYRPGFEVRTHRLCRRIIMFHHFDQLGQSPAPVGAVTLVHSENPAGSTLRQIEYTGYRTDIQTREITSRTLPPLSFTYSEPDMGRHFHPITETAAANLPQGLSGLNYRWMDLYGEGLSGILTETNQAWYYKSNLGQGQFGHQMLVAQKPPNLVGSYALSDFDSDGNPNLVVFAGRQAGYCEYNRDNEQWQGYRPFPSAPVLEEMETSAQWIDLNGDGRADIIISRQDRFTWYPSEGKDGFGAPVEFANPGVDSAAQVQAVEENLHLNYLFADMTGDGLLDRVRIQNGRVEYWPQLGNGRFGDAIVMENAPSFDFGDQFDLGRLRLADLDGSGTADLIYIGRGDITYWINAGGNQFVESGRIPGLPYIDNVSSVQVLDFLGDGTACLVWSSPLNSQAHAPINYFPITGGIQPRLLLSVDNAMGKRVDLTYSNSGRHYLRDKLTERPWISKLPNHTTVVDRMDVWDLIGHTRFCSRYEYHDGFFDSGEREFRGFGQVDRYDSEIFDPLSDIPEDSFTNPACIRTFYHNGAFGWDERRRQHYYQGDPDHALLPEPVFHQQLDFFGKTFEDGFRTLAGSMLRQEIFGVSRDGQREEHPFQVTQNTYRIRQLQPARKDDDACFDVYLSETLIQEYEQDPQDPRVTHEFTLDVDEYGNATRTCAVAYPRRETIPDALDDQRRIYISVATNGFMNINGPNRLETGIPKESKAYELAWPEMGPEPLLAYDIVFEGVKEALKDPCGVDETLPLEPETHQARLIQWQRFFYWSSVTATALPLGEVGAKTLLHHQETACFNNELVNKTFGNRVDADMLETQGRYLFQTGYWWQRGPITHYGNADTFYSLDRLVRLDGGTTLYQTDEDYHLALVAVTDAVENRTRAEIDYNLIAPWQITDPNETVAEVRYDPLGMILVSTTQGTVVGDSGSSALYGHDLLQAYTPQPDADTNVEAILADPMRFIQNAGQFLYYDLGPVEGSEENAAPVDEQEAAPLFSLSLVREQWVHDGSGDPPGESPVQILLTYMDGFGRTLQSKQKVEEGPAVQRDAAGNIILDPQGRPLEAWTSERWRASGHTVYNNKQLPVQQYEPFFSTLTRFEEDEELQTFGVSTLSRYDALGRLVQTELPNGTLTKVETTPWETRNFDPNDTVRESAYGALHELIPEEDPDNYEHNPEWMAYNRALAHADTPAIVRRDPMGREIEQEETSHDHLHRITCTRLDIQGNTTGIIDPRILTAFTYHHDMLGRVMHEHSMDAGDKWMLADALDQPLHLWDGRRVHKRFFHDRLGRPTGVHVDAHLERQQLDHTTEHMVYGDDPAVEDGAARNAKGRLVEHYDQAGLITIRQYAPDGNPLHTERRLVQLTGDYNAEPDWSEMSAVSLEKPFVTRVCFDVLGRVTRQELPDRTTRTFVYLPSGGVNQVLVTTADDELIESPFLQSCTYNARGQRTEALLGNDILLKHTYSPDTFRLTNIQAIRVANGTRTYQNIDYTYDPAGNITRQLDRSQQNGNGGHMLRGLGVSPECDYTYDAFYQLRTATGRVHQALFQNDYQPIWEDPLRMKGTRRISLNDASRVERYTRTYSYDEAGNIEFIHHQGNSRSWNTMIQTSETSNRSLPTRDLNGIEIENIEGHFDPNGNCEYMPHLRQLDWNYRNNIATAVIIERSENEGGDDVEYYVYGGDGMRVRKLHRRLILATEPGRSDEIELTEKIYLDGCEIKRTHRNGALVLDQTTSHITDGADRIALLHQSPGGANGITEKKTRYQLSNHLGSSVLEVNEHGDVITYEEYFPYGGTAFIGGDQREVRFKDYRYSGKERDDGTGFYYYGYRYYASWIGNWLSPDPIGLADSLNLYQYVQNNPVNLSDPGGLCSACGCGDRDWAWWESQMLLDELREVAAEHGIDIPEGQGGSYDIEYEYSYESFEEQTHGRMHITAEVSPEGLTCAHVIDESETTPLPEGLTVETPRATILIAHPEAQEFPADITDTSDPEGLGPSAVDPTTASAEESVSPEEHPRYRECLEEYERAREEASRWASVPTLFGLGESSTHSILEEYPPPAAELPPRQSNRQLMVEECPGALAGGALTGALITAGGPIVLAATAATAGGDTVDRLAGERRQYVERCVDPNIRRREVVQTLCGVAGMIAGNRAVRSAGIEHPAWQRLRARPTETEEAARGAATGNVAAPEAVLGETVAAETAGATRTSGAQVAAAQRALEEALLAREEVLRNRTTNVRPPNSIFRRWRRYREEFGNEEYRENPPPHSVRLPWVRANGRSYADIPQPFQAIIDFLNRRGLLRVKHLRRGWINLNVAIAEIRIPRPQGGHVTRYVVAIAGRSLHSEPILLATLEKMGIRGSQVIRFFSSGRPCAACDALVGETLPHLSIEYAHP